MSPDNTRKDNESAEKPRPNLGRFSGGKWYCECPESPEANRYKASEGTENEGKWFWRCRKRRLEGCKFWLLEEEEEIRKAKLVRMGLLDSPLPKTPSTNKRKRGEDRSSPITESGTSNPIDVKEEYSPGTLADEDDAEGIYADTPSKKAPKNKSVSTPQQPRREMAPGPMTPGPSNQRDVASRPQPLDVVSTPHQNTKQSIKPTTELSAKILELLSSKKVQLDVFTKLRIDHLVGLEIKQHKAAISQYQLTNETLSSTIEEGQTLAPQEQTTA